MLTVKTAMCCNHILYEISCKLQLISHKMWLQHKKLCCEHNSSVYIVLFKTPNESNTSAYEG